MYPRLESVEIVEKVYQKQLKWIRLLLAKQEQKDEEFVRRMEELDLELDEMADHPQQVTQSTLRTFRNAHHNFYRKAVTDLYMHNRMNEARYYFKLLCEQYPEMMAFYIGFDKNTGTVDLDTFVQDRIVEDIKTGGRSATMAQLENMIVGAYNTFSRDQDDYAKGLIRLAQRTYERYHRRKVGTEEDRVLLPPFEHIHNSALNKALKDLDENRPLAAANLRRRLGLKNGEEAKYAALPELVNPFDEEKKKATPGAGN